MGRPFVTFVTIACSVGVSAPLEAAPAERHVVVLGLEARGGLDAVAGGVTRSVRRVASVRPGWRVAPTSLSVAEAKLTYMCLDDAPDCWAQVGAALEADLLVTGSVGPDGDTIAVRLLLYDVQRGALIRRMDRAFMRDLMDRDLPEAAREMLSPAAARETPREAPGESRVPPRSSPDRLEQAAVVEPPAEFRPGPAPEPAVADVGHGPRPPSRRFLGWGLLGAGGAMTGVGLVFGLLAQDAASEFDLPDTPERRAHELKDDGETYAAGANVLDGVGAALAVSGAVLLVIQPGGTDVRAHPGGVAVRGRF